MDFSHTEEQEAVRDLARQIFGDACDNDRLRTIANDAEGDGYDHDLWRALAQSNLLGVALPEKYEGSDLGLQALYLMFEEAGRFLAPLPLLPTLVYGALPIAAFGSEPQKERWLPGVVAGETVLSAALEEVGVSHPAQPKTRAARSGDGGWVIDGEKVCVPAARLAARILVPAATDDGVCVFLVDPAADGVSLEAAMTTNQERQFRMLLSGVRVTADDVLAGPETGAQVLDWLDQRAQVALCSMQLGVASEALRMTAEYTSTRKQFGRAIATFQGVALRAADGFIDLEAMRSTTWQAAWRLEAGLPASAEIAAAKWWACRGGERVVHSAMHLHGGMGSDVDHAVHRYFLWARQLDITLGSAGEQLSRLGRLIAREA